MERKQITLGYRVTDLVGIRVATDTRCHPRIATIGEGGDQEGGEPGLSAKRRMPVPAGARLV